MHNDMRAQLKALKGNSDIAPNAAWVKSTRDRVHAHARASAASDMKRYSLADIVSAFNILVPTRMYVAMRGVFVFLLIIGVVSSGLVATASPVPREIVFNVKVAVAAAVGNDEAKAQLHIEEAGFQTKELNEVRVKEAPKLVEKKLKKIKKQIAAASVSLEKVQEEDGTKATDLAKDLAEQTTQIAEKLKVVTEEAAEATEKDVEEATEEVADVSDVVKEVVETRKVVNESGIDAIEVLANSDEIGDEQVKQIVEEKIGDILEEAQEIKTIAEVITEEVAEGEGIILVETEEIDAEGTEDTAAEDGAEEDVEGVSSTDVVIHPDGTTSTSIDILIKEVVEKEEGTEVTAETVEKVDESAEKVSDLSEDITKLLEEDQITEAVEKTKILNDVTAEAEAVLVEVKKQVQETVDAVKENPEILLDEDEKEAQAQEVSTIESVPTAG